SGSGTDAGHETPHQVRPAARGRRVGDRVGGGQGLLVALLEAGADLVGGVGAAAPLVARQDGARRRDPGQPRQPDQLPHAPASRHTPRLRTVAAPPITLDEAVDLSRTGDVWVFRGRTV